MHRHVNTSCPFAKRVVSDTDAFGCRCRLQVFSYFRHFGCALRLVSRSVQAAQSSKPCRARMRLFPQCVACGCMTGCVALIGGEMVLCRNHNPARSAGMDGGFGEHFLGNCHGAGSVSVNCSINRQSCCLTADSRRRPGRSGKRQPDDNRRSDH